VNTPTKAERRLGLGGIAPDAQPPSDFHLQRCLALVRCLVMVGLHRGRGSEVQCYAVQRGRGWSRLVCRQHS
jgi:hypothetical protein